MLLLFFAGESLVTYYLTSFDSVDLNAASGLVTPGVSGVHSAPKVALQQMWLPGGTTAHTKVLRREMRTITFKGRIFAETHTALVTALDALKRYLMPDDDFHALVVADKPGKQIMAIFTGNEIACDILPNERDWFEVTVPFLCYPYWEDITPQTAIIAPAFLSFRQATFEHTALDGWESFEGGTVSLETSGAYSGDNCMKVVTPYGAALVVSGITPGEQYSFQARLKGSVGAELIRMGCRWYTAADVYISDSLVETKTLTADWALYKHEGITAPATAAKTKLVLYKAGSTYTFYVDDVCLEEAATCGDFITPYDANTVIYNGGDTVCYPEWTCELDDDMPAGLDFTIGTTKFEYEGPLVSTDSLVVTTDQQAPDVKLNGVRDFANTTVESAYPALAKGSNAVDLSDSTKFHLHMSARQRYW